MTKPRTQNASSVLRPSLSGGERHRHREGRSGEKEGGEVVEWVNEGEKVA